LVIAEESSAKLPAGYIDEAPLPEGYPPPGEVGQVIEKEYPVTRSYSATGQGAFMKCFAYLVKQKHEMTAPVVMEYTGDKSGAEADPNEAPVTIKRMHFLLEKISQDEPKEQGPVTVADIPKLRVLSVAYQGRMNPAAIAEATAKLQAAMAVKPELKAAGEIRILGYNGPMVPRDKVYWEVQIPLADPAK
ncbi:MAG: heme-binding protein, partial [Verrucomicrobiota bacterium]